MKNLGIFMKRWKLSYRWLMDETGYSRSVLSSVINGRTRATPMCRKLLFFAFTRVTLSGDGKEIPDSEKVEILKELSPY